MASILDTGFRGDLIEAHRRLAEGLGRPGTWWTGAERVAIAAEVRRALDHADLPPWETPSARGGLIDERHPLSPPAVDAIWRITNHPGTLTHDWYEATLAGLQSAEHYVEMAGIVAMVSAVDCFASIMDLDPLPLPEPQRGSPSRERADGTSIDTHWVPTAPGAGPNVLRALSAVPADQPLQQALSDAQYLPADALLGDLDWGRPTLDRRQIELLAARTSMVNECFY